MFPILCPVALRIASSLMGDVISSTITFNSEQALAFVAIAQYENAVEYDYRKQDISETKLKLKTKIRTNFEAAWG